MENKTGIESRVKKLKASLASKSSTLLGIHAKYHLSSKSKEEREKEEKSFIESIETTILNAVGRLKLYPAVEAGSTELDTYFQQGQEFPPELQEYNEALFNQVLSFSESRSGWTWEVFAVMGIGILQIIAGVLLVYCTAGIGISIGASLIAEGAGDIFFAVEAGFRKNFRYGFRM
jgi:hypothetical protein